MNFKINSAALALVALVVAAAAPMATAATPEGDPESGKFPVSATATSGPSKMSTSLGSITCTSGSGTGQANSKTTGEGSYTMSGCNDPFGGSCTSTGQSAGTIKLETVTLDLVYLDENHTKPGVLATPPASGVFAKFSCKNIGNVEVKGNGVLGALTSPSCGQKSKTATVAAEIVSGVQKYQQIEETGTHYDMTAFLLGSSATAATEWSVTGTSSEASTLTCPEQK